MRNVEPPVIDERKEESSLAKLEWLIVLIRVADAANEKGFGWTRALGSFDGGGT